MDIRVLVAGGVFATAFAGRPAAAEDLIFALDNQSSAAVHEFYASPVDVNDWKQNILGQGVLEPGKTTQVTIRDGRPVCRYDLRIVFSEGEELDEQDIDLCETGSYTLTDPGE